ncbi:MAG: hypothetical protein H0V44_12220 [Planctomycetes bacterium]|nr:hypothetical protein [Planctomycetota bacterium]
MTCLRPAALLLCLAALVSTGCGGTRYMEPGARIDTPPEGKALVNVHRPSTAYGSGADLIVWDGDTVIGNTHGKDMFQYVCEPGAHVFHARQANVSVLRADLAAGKTYDIVTDCGPNLVPFQANHRLWLNAIAANDERRGLVDGWLAKEKTLVLSTKSEGDRLAYQKKALPDVRKYLHDFTDGDKKDKAGSLAAGDGR